MRATTRTTLRTTLMATALSGALLLPLAPAAFAAPGAPAPAAAPAVAPLYGELAQQGTFADPKAAAAVWWSSTGTERIFADNTFRITAKPVAQTWKSIVGQDGIHLRKGARYTLSFDASANVAGAKMRALVQEGIADWANAGIDETVTLDTKTQSFRWSFVSKIDTAPVPGTAGKEKPYGQIAFQLGGQAVDTEFAFSNVRLTTSTDREGFYVDPDSNAMKWVDGRDRVERGETTKPVPPQDARRDVIKASVADKMTVRWFGDWNKNTITKDVSDYVAAAARTGQVPTIVAYNIYGRDCNGASRGGAASVKEYKDWIKGFAEGIGQRPAIVILEPDAVPQANCLSQAGRDERFDMLWYANQRLDEQGPLVKTYIDAGNSSWTLGKKPDGSDGIGLKAMAEMLGRAGIFLADGFANNAANYHSTDIANDYGRRLVAQVKQDLKIDTTFVVDTGRNGNGAFVKPGDPTSGQVGYCNAPKRKLGTPAQAGEGGAAYYLWIKNPGDSDGGETQSPDCKGSKTNAGHFSPDYAWNLINGL